MRTSKWQKVVILAVALAGVVTLGWWAAQREATHPEFGRIYAAEMSESYKDTQTKWDRFVAAVRQRLHQPKRPDPPKYGLPVGSEVLGWSIHNNHAPNRDGWIYLRDAVPRKRPALNNQPMWEIALSEKKQLADVSNKDFNREFYTMNDPRGKATFGSNWDSSAMIVPEGQILFARLMTNHSVIYVVRLAQQGGPSDYGSMKIEYAIATNQPAR